jgi:hypothetical protein
MCLQKLKHHKKKAIFFNNWRNKLGSLSSWHSTFHFWMSFIYIAKTSLRNTILTHIAVCRTITVGNNFQNMAYTISCNFFFYILVYKITLKFSGSVVISFFYQHEFILFIYLPLSEKYPWVILSTEFYCGLNMKFPHSLMYCHLVIIWYLQIIFSIWNIHIWSMICNKFLLWYFCC